MPELENSNKRLMQGLCTLLRNNVDGWSTNSEYGVDNVWPPGYPKSVEEEFPRGVVDVVAADDTELSVDLNVKLRENTVKLVVFGESGGIVEDLIDDSEDAIEDFWNDTDSNGDKYLGDWSLREFDGSTPMNETGESEGDLKYNRSSDFIFETIRKK